MLVKLIVRVALVTFALMYITPYMSGVKFHGDWINAILASLVFNAAFFGLEMLLGVIVFSINIGTLGLGAFISGTIKFVAALVSPSVALYGASKVLPHALSIGSYFPGALIYGFMLGGVLWASIPDKKKA